jgi:hypothetical protein
VVTPASSFETSLLARRTMQWAEVGGQARLLAGGKINRFIPDPTFSKLARPYRHQ